MTALHRHPPCLRVYRALFEIVLGLLCTAFSLRVWESTKSLDDGSMIGFLLFRPPPYGDKEAMVGAAGMGEMYVPFSAADDDMEEDGGAAGGGGDEVPLSACDAATPNASDEEDDLPITPPTTSRLTSSIDDNDDANNNDEFLSKPPSSISVIGAALDLLLVTLVSLFLFTISSAEGGKYIDNNKAVRTTPSIIWERIADVAAPIFPLVLFFVGVVKALLPWAKKRRDFWYIVSLTICAPYHDVTFRDGFIGDILTSTVRPLQDIAFTTFYIVSGLQGWWTKSYGIDDAAVPVEHSWLLHTVVLPACMISPLWWRFLQNLRQTYDAKQRWPYLGNALKYFVAAEVAVFGLFDPSKKQTFIWIASFVCATLYQIWWDVFMDWELLVWKDEPSSLPFGIRWPFALRSQRLYQRRSTYIFIFTINFLLRFCWTLTFIPMRYLTQSGILEDHFRSDFQTLAGPAMACAEIIRRSLWGLIRVELEAIKTMNKKKDIAGSEIELSNQDKESDNLVDEQWELKPMSIECASGREGGLSASLASIKGTLKSQGAIVQSDMSSLSDHQIMIELCLYATVFTAIGMIAAAHRQVM